MPDNPIGSKKTRIRKALYWYWARDMTQEEIGEKLGVGKSKVNEYIHASPQSDAVKEQLDNLETQVRFVAVEQLREQLKQAGSRAQSAERPVKIWEDDNGDLRVKDKHNDRGEVVDKFAVPANIEMGVDSEQRFYGRQEAREIIDLLTDIVGGKAAERHKHEVTGENGGPIEVSISETVVESDWEPPESGSDADSEVIDTPDDPAAGPLE